MIANPALLASLFITAVTSIVVEPTEQTPGSEFVQVTLSDGTQLHYASIIETGEPGAIVFRAGLNDGVTEEVVIGPIVNETHRAMFHSAGIELPNMTPIAAEAPAGPTAEAIAQHAELVQKGIDEAAAAEAARLAALEPPAAPHTSEAPDTDERPTPIPPQQHFDRLFALLDVVMQQLPSSHTWTVREMRVIYEDLGIEPSK